MRYTGFPAAVKDLIHARSGGVCELLIPMVCTGRAEQIHHRRPRGLGGTHAPEVSAASNGVDVCAACHGYAEANRAEAQTNGWLVSQWASPAEVAILYRSRTRMRLTDDGGYAVDMEGAGA